MNGVLNVFSGLGGINELVDLGADVGEKVGESGFFGGSEVAEDKIDVAETLLDCGIAGAEAQARKILAIEVRNGGFEAVVATGGAFGTVADLAKWEVEIVADN